MTKSIPLRITHLGDVIQCKPQIVQNFVVSFVCKLRWNSKLKRIIPDVHIWFNNKFGKRYSFCIIQWKYFQPVLNKSVFFYHECIKFRMKANIIEHYR